MSAATGKPAQMEGLQVDQLQHMHQEAREKLLQYIGSADEETLERTRTLGPVTVSNRKVLAQAVLHSVHHWAQVAMDLRAASLQRFLFALR